MQGQHAKQTDPTLRMMCIYQRKCVKRTHDNYSFVPIVASNLRRKRLAWS